MGGCRNAGAEIVVINTEANNSMDSEGNRWPDEVVLTGEAKEMWEWSLRYGLGDRDKEQARLLKGVKKRRGPGRRGLNMGRGWRRCSEISEHGGIAQFACVVLVPFRLILKESLSSCQA
jgi:hypothetical protein